MIDIRLLRDDPEVFKKDLRKRFETEKNILVDEIIKYDQEKRELTKQVSQLRHKRNLLTAKIAGIRHSGGDAVNVVEEARKINEMIRNREEKRDEIDTSMKRLLPSLPNLTHESVPVGRDERDNITLRTCGEKPQFDFKPKDHIKLGLRLDLIDIERAAKISGARFTFLKREAVEMEFALLRLALDTVVKDGFIPVIPPVMVRRKAMYGAGFLPSGKEDIYWIKDKDLCLIGTAEISLAAMHMDEILNEDKLPLNYAGFSTCFRTEAGSHGRDTKGIFRVHQFDKLELFKFTTPESSWQEHQKLIMTAEKIFKKLELPYKIVNICSGELGPTAAKKFDLELWLPGQEKYREVVSCSNCTDYQSRRLNIRYRKNPDEKPKFVHTLNSTAIAMGRTLVAILENFQEKDGSIKIPQALYQYLDYKKIKVF